MCPVAAPTAAPIAAPRATDTPIDRALCTSSLIISSKNLISRVDGCLADFFGSTICSPKSPGWPTLVTFFVTGWGFSKPYGLRVPHFSRSVREVGVLSFRDHSLLPEFPSKPLPRDPCSECDACDHYHHFQSLHHSLLNRSTS